ncbi:hypothetical protein EJ05DRAFT_320075 [Pseudovirgaria hyperparasitica]|uniref:Uncharacterized protein n=1 Tax=Pseudovirgaria hyperparasitica TaxID=470096 RepID=A0A6A6WDB1_9PEZI|nr:uncharacterized protein EJ05DRAFT_320075 [Pseudovirgaria hyperparasitica]KAF2760044.1 hypothetical protein EJ05DRAFT_320075 [Pseudovirgaria hyperparasitica]
MPVLVCLLFPYDRSPSISKRAEHRHPDSPQSDEVHHNPIIHTQNHHHQHHPRTISPQRPPSPLPFSQRSHHKTCTTDVPPCPSNGPQVGTRTRTHASRLKSRHIRAARNAPELHCVVHCTRSSHRCQLRFATLCRRTLGVLNGLVGGWLVDRGRGGVMGV